MQLVSIYGWDIDFVLDIRKGDKFKLIYEEQFKEDIKVSEGPILAAEFYNNKNSLKQSGIHSPMGIMNISPIVAQVCARPLSGHH